MFAGLGHQRPNFDGYILIHYQRHLFPPVSQRLFRFGFRVQRVGSTMQNLRSVGENSDPILSRLWTKVHEIFKLSNAFSDCLFHVSFRR